MSSIPLATARRALAFLLLGRLAAASDQASRWANVADPVFQSIDPEGGRRRR
jgi:hypothetical protein